MNWQEKIHNELISYSKSGKDWDKASKMLKFRIWILHTYWDLFTWDAIKSGFPMIRLKWKKLMFRIKKPHLYKIVYGKQKFK